MSNTKLWTTIWMYRTPLFAVFLLVLLLPVTLRHGSLCSDAAEPEKCGESVLVCVLMVLMGLLWCTEVIPIPVTSLLPIVYLPLAGVMTTTEVAERYLEPLAMLLVGGVMVALGIERSGLHKRIAIGILRIVGAERYRLLFGCMFGTWLLSMFISNTAATAMMLPIADSLVTELLGAEQPQPANTQDEPAGNPTNNNRKQSRSFSTSSHRNSLAVTELGSYIMELEDLPARKNRSLLPKLFTLSIPYAANIGGIGFLTGTPANLVVKKFSEELWEEHGMEGAVTFGTWTLYALPIATIVLLIIWGYMVVIMMVARKLGRIQSQSKRQRKRANEIIQREWDDLGPIRFAEGAMSVMFGLLILLWFLRQPHFMTGWSAAFKDKYIKDCVPAIFIAILLFVIPLEKPSCKGPHDREIEYLMDWDTVQHKLPWGIISLFGGGLTLAEAAKRSGVTTFISSQLLAMSGLPSYVLIFLLSLIVALLTEFTTNTATCSLLMPVMSSMALSMDKSPLYLMLSTGVTTSFAFMLPVATPPNAIAFATGRLRIIDMVVFGAALNILSAAVVSVATNTWGYTFFDMGVIPWATHQLHNSTDHLYGMNTTVSPT